LNDYFGFAAMDIFNRNPWALAQKMGSIRIVLYPLIDDDFCWFPLNRICHVILLSFEIFDRPPLKGQPLVVG
jgi:hypothetical protein